MLVTNNNDFFKTASILHDHGRDPKIKKTFWAEKVGFKYKMSNLQAALGLAQIQRVEELVDKKIEIFRMYKDELSKIEGISMNHEQEYVKNSYWMPTIILDKELGLDRNKFIDYLNSFGIGARPFFYPVSNFPEFDEIVENNVSNKIGKNGINLPSNFDMNERDVEYIVKMIKKYFE